MPRRRRRTRQVGNGPASWPGRAGRTRDERAALDRARSLQLPDREQADDAPRSDARSPSDEHAARERPTRRATHPRWTVEARPRSQRRPRCTWSAGWATAASSACLTRPSLLPRRRAPGYSGARRLEPSRGSRRTPSVDGAASGSRRRRREPPADHRTAAPRGPARIGSRCSPGFRTRAAVSTRRPESPSRGRLNRLGAECAA